MSFLFPNKSFLTCYLVVNPSAYTFYPMLSASGVSWGTPLGSEVLMLPTIAASRQDSRISGIKGQKSGPQHMLALGAWLYDPKGLN